MGWTHSAAAVLASFLASLVEFVEALTIVLAVGVTRGWRSAIAGALLGVALLTALVAAFGTSLQLVPLKSVAVARRDTALECAGCGRRHSGPAEY
jgi:uncharacterized membrane protein